MYDIQILSGTRPCEKLVRSKDLLKNIQNFFKKRHDVIFDDVITFFEK